MALSSTGPHDKSTGASPTQKQTRKSQAQSCVTRFYKSLPIELRCLVLEALISVHDLRPVGPTISLKSNFKALVRGDSNLAMDSSVEADIWRVLPCHARRLYTSKAMKPSAWPAVRLKIFNDGSWRYVSELEPGWWDLGVDCHIERDLEERVFNTVRKELAFITKWMTQTGSEKWRRYCNFTTAELRQMLHDRQVRMWTIKEVLVEQLYADDTDKMSKGT